MMVVNASTFAQTSNLPELGDSSTQYLNPAQERQIGQAFYRQLIANPAFVEDYQLQDYLQSIGNRVGAIADLRGMKLSFNLIEDNTLNAFAVPGGYITFNTGLLTTTKTESALASVVGHEIAHLTQRHLPRLLAKSSESKIPLIAAIIGSVLVGGQAGLVGLTAASANAASNKLRYTRGFEREADAIGIKLMANAKYDPIAMAEFFGDLERFNRQGDTEIPAFLLTHPLSAARRASSESRAREYPSQPHASSFEFYLAKARIRTLYTKRRDDPVAFFKDQIEVESTGIDTEVDAEVETKTKDAAIYGTVIALTKARKLQQARAVITPLSERYPNHPWIQSAHADIDLADGKVDQAIARYQMLISNNPDKVYLNYYLAHAFLLNHEPEIATKTMRYQIRRHPDLYRLYKLLSEANAQQGNLAESHQANADYHATLGNYSNAIESLKLALQQTEAEGYLAQSITAQISDLEEKLELQSKIDNG